ELAPGGEWPVEGRHDATGQLVPGEKPCSRVHGSVQPAMPTSVCNVRGGDAHDVHQGCRWAGAPSGPRCQRASDAREGGADIAQRAYALADDGRRRGRGGGEPRWSSLGLGGEGAGDREDAPWPGGARSAQGVVVSRPANGSRLNGGGQPPTAATAAKTRGLAVWPALAQPHRADGQPRSRSLG